MNAERTCEQIQADLSGRLDGTEAIDSDALDAHLRHCADCRSFERGARSLRQRLRYEQIRPLPDMTAAVVSQLSEPRRGRGRPVRRRRILAVAAAFAVGGLVGALLVAYRGTEPGPMAAADLPDRVAAAQFELTGIESEFTLVERGWNEAISERQWDGHLEWSSPETLSLEFDDRTDYPSPGWVRDDVALVVDGARMSSVGPRDCPAEAQPDCTPEEPQIDLTTGREPFADGAPVPLDLVLPVASFADTAPPDLLGERTLAGRDAIGLRTTVAQIRPMLDGLRPAGNLREAHPTDPVELWLDRETMTPLLLVVHAGDAMGRATWAANRGYSDEPGDVVLEMRVDEIRYGPSTPDLGRVADLTRARRDGFTDGPVPTLLVAARVPLGFELYRTGTLAGEGPEVDVATWTNGRAWIKIRSTPSWTGGRLFGSLGPMVRAQPLSSGGMSYFNDRGDRVAIHTAHLDVVVTGSVSESLLLSAAESLALTGEVVPPDWDEAATADLADAQQTIPGLLVPAGIDGFASPAVRVDGSAVTIRYAGPGDRSFTLVESTGDRLSPPLDASVTAIDVRGVDGRWSSARRELEWAEDGLVISLRSPGLGLDELVAVAESMRAP